MDLEQFLHLFTIFNSTMKKNATQIEPSDSTLAHQKEQPIREDHVTALRLEKNNP